MEDVKSIFIKNLSNQLDKHQMTQIDLANAIGVSKSVMSSWITGKRFPKMNSIQQLADYFCIEKSDLIEDKSKKNKIVPSFDYFEVPIGIAAGALQTVEGQMSLPHITVADIWLGQYARDKRIVIMHVNGESMNRIIPNGSIIAVLTGVKLEDIKDGDVVIMQNCHGESTVKRFYDDIENKRFILRPDSTNPVFADMFFSYDNVDDMEIIGKVVVYSVIM